MECYSVTWQEQISSFYSDTESKGTKENLTTDGFPSFPIRHIIGWNHTLATNYFPHIHTNQIFLPFQYTIYSKEIERSFPSFRCTSTHVSAHDTHALPLFLYVPVDGAIALSLSISSIPDAWKGESNDPWRFISHQWMLGHLVPDWDSHRALERRAWSEGGREQGKEDVGTIESDHGGGGASSPSSFPPSATSSPINPTSPVWSVAIVGSTRISTCIRMKRYPISCGEHVAGNALIGPHALA
jgi:hypothetical protein